MDAGRTLTAPLLPPLTPLRHTLAALTTAGFSPVVGGSALLVALGIAAEYDGAEIDVIVDFAVQASDGAIVRVAARPGIPWRGLPMARADDWIAAYTAMGRPERVAALRRSES